MRDSAIGRWLFDDRGLRKGYLRVTDDSVEEICEGDPPRDSLKALVLPGFVNAHTHIGDSFAYPAPRGRVEEIVAPPDGYKHRVLRAAPAEKKIAAMQEAASYMARTGTSAFIDFREEGLKGLREMAASVTGCPVQSVVLGRPSGHGDQIAEASSVLDACDGLGLSAPRDFEVGALREMSSMAHAAGKAFALHASECVREQIDAILDTRPAFLVHMNAADDADYERCAKANVPIVVCPRSNEFFGLRPKIVEMKRSGVSVALGTDNGMISIPDMIEEMKAAFRIGRATGALEPSDVVELATSGGRKVLNATGKILTNGTSDSDFVVIRVYGDDPLLELVTEARSEHIHAVVRGGKVWRAETCRR